MFDAMEVQWFQITPIGMSRLQSGQLRHLDSASQQVLKEIGELGGTAEWDELKIYGTKDSPSVLSTALRRLVDLGYVAAVAPQQQQPVSLVGGL